MKRVRRFTLITLFHLARVLLRPVDSLSPRLFMVVYVFILRYCGVKFNGIPRYISTGVKFDNFDLVEVGDRVVISDRVIILTHDYSITTMLLSIGISYGKDRYKESAIIIGNNVFIGMGSILMPGCRIGNNVVIGAGSVVRGIIDDGSVIIGNPATMIGRTEEYAYKLENTPQKTIISD